MIKIKLTAAALMLAAFFAGCTYTHNVKVYMSPELKERYGYYPSLEVDLAGLNVNEKNWFDSYDMDKYFEADNPLRKSLAPITMRFSEDDPSMLYLERGSDIWSVWKRKGAEDLYIVVNLPEARIGKSSSGVLTLKIKSNIFKSHDRFVEIKPTGINLLPKPPAYYKGSGRNADALR